MNKNQWDSNLYETKHNFVTNYGNDIIETLNPQANETILDLGCGSGELTAKIANIAKHTIGVDASSEMINKAKLTYPNTNFILHNAETKFNFIERFDAVFSNAALHWMLDADSVVKNISEVLKPDGRLVFEMGGKNNIATIIEAIEYGVNKLELKDNLPIYNFFPSIAEYSAILEKHNFKVTYAILFERPTRLIGEDGLRNWIKMFRNTILSKLNPAKHEEFFCYVENFAKSKLYIDNHWFADYVRLRMIAIKQ